MRGEPDEETEKGSHVADKQRDPNPNNHRKAVI